MITFDDSVKLLQTRSHVMILYKLQEGKLRILQYDSSHSMNLTLTAYLDENFPEVIIIKKHTTIFPVFVYFCYVFVLHSVCRDPLMR